MTVAEPVRTPVESPPASDGLGLGLRALTRLLEEHSAPYGFVSLLLAGSLARGEGSRLLTPAGPKPFNDIDLVLVTERPVPAAVVSAWEGEATRLVAPDSSYSGGCLSPLGLHADLAVLPRQRLRRLPRTMFNFDLKSARVLAGDNVLREMPSFRPADIPAREALALLGNRCLSMCESAGEPEAGTALWMYYHSLKAIIDSGAALLMLSGRYRTPHQEQVSRLRDVVRRDYPSLLARWPHLIDMVEAAVVERRRLRPDVKWAEAVVRWKEARGVILQTLRCALARVLGVSEHAPWAELTTGMRRWWTSLDALLEGRRLPVAAAQWGALRTVRRPRRLWAQAAVHVAAPHLLLAIEPRGKSPPEYQHDLALAASYLAEVSGGSPATGRDGDWRPVRDAVVGRWKGIA